MVDLVQFGKVDKTIANRRPQLWACAVVLLMLSKPCEAQTAPEEAPAIGLAGCWRSRGSLPCAWRSSMTYWQVQYCFSEGGTLGVQRFNGCEGEMLGDNYAYDDAGRRFVLEHDGTAVRDHCSVSFLRADRIVLSCGSEPNAFHGVWTKHCSRTRECDFDMVDCADAP